MNKYQIIFDKSDVITKYSILMIRVCVNKELNSKVNLNFSEEIINDYFYDEDLESKKEEAIKYVIEVLSKNKNSLLNKLIECALADHNIQLQLKDKRVGQFEVKEEHFDSRDYRIRKEKN
jgi:hypothetical protein